MDFKSTPLFGGALTADLPKSFADVSDLREVPDHQEVWLNTEGYTNIIFEILERVTADQAKTDEDALKYHMDDITSTETDEVKFWGGGTAHLTKMPDVPCYTLLASQHVNREVETSDGRPRGKQSKEDFTGTFLILVRLEEQKTDLLVAVNVPHIPGEYDEGSVDLAAQKLGSLMEEGKKIRDKVLESFEVKDWGLFVNEEEGGEEEMEG